MSTIKNGQVSLYFYFNKIIKGPGTSFQSPVKNNKHRCYFPCVASNAYDDVTNFEIFGFYKYTKI